MRQAAIFQATLLDQRLEQPLLIENALSDIAEDKPRLILLTLEHEIHGRRFFVEALKAKVLYQKSKNMEGNWCEPEDMISELIDLRASFFSENGL
jgi:hypothetical protein